MRRLFREAGNYIAFIGSLILIIGILVLCITGGAGIAAFREPVDLYADDTDILKLGKTTNLEADIYMVFDYFAKETLTSTYDGVYSSEWDGDYYYCIPAFSGDDTYFIGICVDAQDVEIYDSLTEETYAYLSGDSQDYGTNTIHVHGTLKTMNAKVYEYFVEWFKETGMPEDDIEERVLPIYFNPDPDELESRRSELRAGIVVTLIGAALFTSGLIGYFRQ